MADYAGEQIGNYRLLRLLGQGGFAEVYLAEHLHLGTQAAIKLLHTRLAEHDLEAFRTEARTLARLVHPHIVRVFDFGIQGNLPFLVMDYAPHGSLRQQYPKGTVLPLPTVLSLVQPIAYALQYAHEEQVIHRDIKPENLLLGRRQEVLLSDFGIALIAQTSRSQSTQEVAGTARYMAPEQFQGKPRPASDQYALAIMVYEWLTGQCPFHGSFAEIASQHLFLPPPPLCSKRADLPPAVEEVVLTALAKDPAARFAGVRAFATAFERACQRKAPQPRPADRSASSPGTNSHLSPFQAPAELAEAFSESDIPTDLITPAGPSLLSGGPSLSEQSGVTSRQITPPAFAFPVQSVSAPEDESAPIEAPRRVLSRRAVVIGFTGAVLLGAGVETPTLLSSRPSARQGQQGHNTVPSGSPTRPTTPTTPSNLTLTSSDAMFGYNVQRTHVNPDEHILSPTTVSRLESFWTASTGNRILYSSPAVVDKVVYVGSEDSRLYAFQAATGNVLWTALTSNWVRSSPAVANGVVYVGSEDGKLYAFQAATGNVLWTVSTAGSVGSSPAVVDDIVYAGSLDGKLYAFQAAIGNVLWTASTGNWVSSSPAVVGNVVYVGSWDHTLYAFHTATGNVLWTAPTGDQIRYSSPAVADGIVYIGSQDFKLYAFQAGTGNVIWTASTGGVLGDASPAVANGIVYIGSGDGKLYAFHAATGAILWTAPTGGPISSSPTIANDVVYSGSDDGKLYAFHAATGSILWTATTGGPIRSSPAVVGGVVYVGSADHKLYAFHLPGTVP